MKRHLTVVACLVAAYMLTASGPVWGAGYYGSVRGGAVSRADDGPGFPSPDTGYAVAGTAGYVLPNGLTLEGEVSFRELNSGGMGGRDRHYGFFANMLYEFAEGYVRPYVGAGAGVAVTEAENVDLLGAEEDAGSAFAWQAIGGLAFQVTTRVDLLLDYRFTGTEGREFGGLDADSRLHSFSGGVRVRF